MPSDGNATMITAEVIRTIRSKCWLLAVLCSFLVAGCPGTKHLSYAPCIKENQKALVVRWGTRDDSAQTAVQYEMLATGLVEQLSIVGTDTTRAELRALGHEQYCEITEQVTRTFVKVQALHSPGVRARFVEYVNAPASVFLRAVWNPDLTTFQSRDMRALYDSLMARVQQE